MRAMMRIVVAMVLVLCVGGSAFAQTASTLTPTVTHQQTAPAQQLTHNFNANTGGLLGRFAFQGGNPVGSRGFSIENYAGDFLSFYSVNQFLLRLGASPVTMMRASTGGVVIGNDPAATAVRLTVNGAINVTGNIAAKYQDVAEWVPSFGDPQPGTVVVLSEDAANHVVASHQPYDTRVAGVISHQPGVILGEPGDTKVQVATTGRVKVMVDATKAPIKIGDLLVTSEKPGVAMKSMPVEVGGFEMHRPGTLVGKALEPLAEGTGEILVLLSLQ